MSHIKLTASDSNKWPAVFRTKTAGVSYLEKPAYSILIIAGFYPKKCLILRNSKLSTAHEDCSKPWPQPYSRHI